MTAAGLPLDSDPEANRRGLRLCIFARQSHDIRDRDAGDARNPLRRIFLRALLKLRVADCVFLYVVAIDQIFIDDYIDHTQRQRAVGAGPDRNVPVGFFGGAIAHRIDHHHLRAATPGLRDNRPQMKVGTDYVTGPDDDVAGVNEALRVGAWRGTDRHYVAGGGPGGAKGALAYRRAEPVEERIADVEAVEQALGAEIAVGQNRLHAVLGDDCSEAARDLVERRIPTYPFELAAPLGSAAPQRMQNAVRTVDAFDIVIDLDA